MGDNTTISWTDATWGFIRAKDPATGRTGWHCERVTEACRNCYAESMNMKPGMSGGTGYAYKPGNRDKVEIFLHEKALLQPLRWKRGRRIFPLSMTDIFGEFIKEEWWEMAFAVAALTPRHTYQFLTKRPERMRDRLRYEHTPARVTAAMFKVAEMAGKPITKASHPELFDRQGLATVPVKWPLPNVWIGTSICSQQDANEFVPFLLSAPAALHFVSCAPLLGDIDLTRIRPDATMTINALAGKAEHLLGDRATLGKIGWVLTEGESGKDARPSRPEWFRRLRDDCAAAGVAFHHKQNGEWVPYDSSRDIQLVNSHIAAARSAGRLIRHIRPDGTEDPSGRDATITMTRVGLAKAGRQLDGVTHDAFPVVP